MSVREIVVSLHRFYEIFLKTNCNVLRFREKDSPEAQIALFSYRIAHLTEHLKVNKKDHTTQRALKMLVGKRRKLLDYLMRVDINRYRELIAKKELGIRK